MSEFGIVDLTAGSVGLMGDAHKLDLDQLTAQLQEIRDRLSKLVDAPPQGALGLSSIEVQLTVSLEGKVLFVAKGSAEASVTMTFSRPG